VLFAIIGTTLLTPPSSPKISKADFGNMTIQSGISVSYMAQSAGQVWAV